MRAADGIAALFGAKGPEAIDGATLLSAYLIKTLSGTWPKLPPEDEE